MQIELLGTIGKLLRQINIEEAELECKEILEEADLLVNQTQKQTIITVTNLMFDLLNITKEFQSNSKKVFGEDVQKGITETLEILDSIN